MQPIDTATVLARVLTSGVVMSIEKSDRELPGLERRLTKPTGKAYAVLVNSRTAALHAALTGMGVGHGGEVAPPALAEPDRRFLAWLGVRERPADRPDFGLVTLDAGNADRLAGLVAEADATTVAVDLTGLGFGPAGAVLTDDTVARDRAERLKIFGAFDLRTMWTQEEHAPGLVPGVQFNYRLSPLVAACLRMALTKADRPLATRDAHR